MGKPAAIDSILTISGGYQDLTPEQFAGRHSEIDEIAGFVEEAAEGNIKTPVVEYYGVVGQGKSWLISFVAHHYWHRNGRTPSGTHPTVSAKIDLARYESQSNPESLIIAELASQLASQIPESDVREMDLAALGAEAQASTGSAAPARTLVARITGLSRRYTPVLTFDATDKAPEALLDWIEAQIVQPLIFIPCHFSRT